MTERKNIKRNGNRVKAKDRALYSSMQRNYNKPKPKPLELTKNLFELSPPTIDLTDKLVQTRDMKEYLKQKEREAKRLQKLANKEHKQYRKDKQREDKRLAKLK